MKTITLAAAALAALLGAAPATAQTLDDTTLAHFSARSALTPRYRPSDQENAVRAENRRFTQQNTRRRPTARQALAPRYRPSDQENAVRAENRRLTQQGARRAARR